MASLIGEQHEVESKRRAWETERQQPTLPERSGISSDSNDGKDNGGCRKEKREQRKNNHVKNKNDSELAMAEWGKKNNLLTA